MSGCDRKTLTYQGASLLCVVVDLEPFNKSLGIKKRPLANANERLNVKGGDKDDYGKSPTKKPSTMARLSI